jgi:hypothetical protein
VPGCVSDVVVKVCPFARCFESNSLSTFAECGVLSGNVKVIRSPWSTTTWPSPGVLSSKKKLPTRTVRVAAAAGAAAAPTSTATSTAASGRRADIGHTSSSTLEATTGLR